MHLIDVWEGVRKRLASRQIRNYGFTPVLTHTPLTFEGVISGCLELLHSCSVGTTLYVLSCLCPDNPNVILDLIHLDLRLPHQHGYLPEKGRYLNHNSDEDVLAQLQAHATRLPAGDQNCFYLELTRRWLLSCPADPAYYKFDECGNEMFCWNLRSELVERILRID
jgi:hypothetical protein